MDKDIDHGQRAIESIIKVKIEELEDEWYDVYGTGSKLKIYLNQNLRKL